MSDAPEELTTAMQERAQAALSFYRDSRSTGDVENRHLRALVLKHEKAINPPSDRVEDHNIRAVTLSDWFPGVAEAGVEVEEPEVRPKRSFFKKKNKDSQEAT